MAREKICGIYKITALHNKKVYIGQSIDIYMRWKSHWKETKYGSNTPLHNAMRKYGKDNFTFEIIEKCQQEIINEREIYWINFYNSHSNGFNLTTGGEGINNKVFTNEEKDRYREIQRGKNKPVLQIDTKGNIVKEWFSCKTIGKTSEYSSSNIWDCIKLRDGYRLAYGFIWIYKNDLNKFILSKYINSDKVYLNQRIYQIDLNGNIVNLWDSVNDVINNNPQFKTTPIYSSANNKSDKNSHKTAYGYVWVYEKNYNNQFDYKLLFRKNINRKTVSQLNPYTNELITTYESISEAGRQIGISGSNISQCLKGVQKTAGGYKWKYCN